MGSKVVAWERGPPPLNDFKLDVFKNRVLERSGLDFGGPRARFWRPRGSILEGLGSIFSRFSRVFGHLGPELAKNLSSRTTPVSNVVLLRQFAALKAEILRSGWAAVSPLGGLQSAAHRRCARRARLHSSTRVLSAKFFSTGPFQKVLWNLVFPSLKFSPQEGGDHRNPSLNLRLLRLVGPLGSIFCPSQACFKNDFEKTVKKV